MSGNSPRDRNAGYFYALLGALCGGSVPVLVKELLTDNGPVALSGVSILLSGLILLLYKPRVVPTRGSLKYLLFIGIVGAGVAPVMYVTGLDATTAVNASLLANGEVLFTTTIAFVVFGERLSRGQASRGLVIAAGIVVVSTNLDLTSVQFLQGLAGNLLILGATLGWGFENNLIAVATREFSPALLSKFRNLIGGGLVTAFVLVDGLTVKLTTFDAALLGLLVLALAGVTYLFIAALEKIGAIRTIFTFSMSTIFGAFFAFAFLDEQVTIAQLGGGALIILGVYLFRRSERQVPMVPLE